MPTPMSRPLKKSLCLVSVFRFCGSEGLLVIMFFVIGSIGLEITIYYLPSMLARQIYEILFISQTCDICKWTFL